MSEPDLGDQPWWSSGVCVADVFARSSDAEFIFDGDFEDDHAVNVRALAWRECIVPVTAFALKTTFTEHLGAVTHQDLNEAFARLRRIEPWIDAAGGIGKALTSCPLLATWRAGKLHVEDGWHRLGSAVFWHHRTTVRIICADLPSLTSGSSRPDAQNMSRIFFTC